MLKILRSRKLAKKIWITLAVMVLPAFLFWGLGSSGRNQKDLGYAGEIFGKKVPFKDYQSALEAVKNTGIMRYGEKFPEIESQINLKSQAWQRIILLYEAKSRRINASDREVIELIEKYPLFQRNGAFDNRLYNEFLRYVLRCQARPFEEQIRQDIIISKLYTQITEGIKMDDLQIRQAYIEINSREKKNYRLDEKKFLAEKEAFGQALLEEKKHEHFAKFVAELNAKAQIK